MIYQPPVYNALIRYAQNTKSRFHMPGHGGKDTMGFLSSVSPYDVTELSETDNLACPETVILEAQRLAAGKFGCGMTLFSCHGATLCIQGALYAALKIKPVSEKSRLYCHRRVHKSVINAFALLGIEPIWIDGISNIPEDCGILVYTHTDYYGNVCSPEVIKGVCDRGIITVADNSHGAHLAFMKQKLHPVSCGVDFTVDSLHKTLPVLTGGACLNLKNEKYASLCREGMTLFGSTSPNYLIMASIDRAIATADGEVLEITAEEIAKLKNELPQYFAFSHGRKFYDPLRIVLECQNPCELYSLLYENSVKCEFYDTSGVVLIPPYGACGEDFEPLKRVLSRYDPGAFTPEALPDYPVPKRAMGIREAVMSPRRTLPIEQCEGKLSAREYSLYPPGIPLIVPGEIFDKNIICRLKGDFETADITELTKRRKNYETYFRHR